MRTFSDWDDPPPAFVEADLVAHCGPVANGSFVQTLTVTDIATGWTECAPLLYREQTLLREVLGEVRRRLPFELLGFDTDNDSVFVNETVRDYCRDSGIVFTRCRPWHKNDQAFVEQKNGVIVRRAVGSDGTAAGTIPCRIAHRVAGRRSKAHGHTGGEVEARPTEARSAGEGDGAAARLVRGRALVHGPLIARAASGGTSRGVPGRAPAHGAASGEGLAEGESDGDGVRRTGRRTGRNANRGVDRGSGDIGSLKTRYPRFERNELGSRKEHFGEATVRELGNIFE